MDQKFVTICWRGAPQIVVECETPCFLSLNQIIDLYVEYGDWDRKEMTGYWGYGLTLDHIRELCFEDRHGDITYVPQNAERDDHLKPGDRQSLKCFCSFESDASKNIPQPFGMAVSILTKLREVPEDEARKTHVLFFHLLDKMWTPSVEV